jgi:O-antigen ligase
VSSGAILIGLASALLINYSEFGRLYERLGDTTVEEGIPDTRQNAWPNAWEKIKRRPILGQGPRYMMDGGLQGATYPGWEYDHYPHNLYLFLLVTIGVVGLIAFMNFFLAPLVRCWKVLRRIGHDLYEGTFIKTGVVIFVVILIDQLKVEFMRMSLVDYWHFIFALLGVFVAVCDRANRRLEAGGMSTVRI